MTKRYITTAIPYMNASPHVGHALDYVQADVLARYYKLIGDEVKFQAGTDEHGGKIWQKAKDEGVEVKEFVDKNAQKLKDFIAKLNVSYTDFIRTTDEEYIRRCQEVWQRLADYIYKDKYEGWYCTGCERFVTDKEYEECHGNCPDHQKPYEKLEEENYYLRLADFKEQTKQAILSGEMVILPEFRKKEMLKLLEETPDVSISRPREQLSWGVPVPGDEEQVMYVWIDALSNYITVLGYPDCSISDWWPATAQFVGKDILRFHAIIWPAMLIGLGLPLPKVISSHGMVLVDGAKMSKSVGNVVDPVEVINKYGVDAFRYYFLRHIDTFADSDFRWEKFENAYNNELANDLGNLVQRLATLIAKNEVMLPSEASCIMPKKYEELMAGFEFSKALDYIWEKIRNLNKRIDDEKPWMLAKNGERMRLEECLNGIAAELLKVNLLLVPFLPETAAKIAEVFDGKITAPKTPLFPKN